MNVHAKPSAARATPALPSAKPDSIGLSPQRLQRMRDAFQREIDKGTTPGVVSLLARRGQIGWLEAQGKQDPAGSAPMEVGESIADMLSGSDAGGGMLCAG